MLELLSYILVKSIPPSILKCRPSIRTSVLEQRCLSVGGCSHQWLDKSLEAFQMKDILGDSVIRLSWRIIKAPVYVCQKQYRSPPKRFFHIELSRCVTRLLLLECRYGVETRHWLGIEGFFIVQCSPMWHRSFLQVIKSSDPFLLIKINNQLEADCHWYHFTVACKGGLYKQ